MARSAKLKFTRIAPRKARLVADMCRGRSAEDAINLLRFTNKAAARPIRKLIESAVANSSEEGGPGAEGLLVREILVDPGPTMKRIRARARGRAAQIGKRMSHITVQLAEMAEK